MAAESLNAYIATLNKLRATINNTIGQIRVLEAELRAPSMGSFNLGPMQRQLDSLNSKLLMLEQTRNRLLSVAPVRGNQNPYIPNWTTPSTPYAQAASAVIPISAVQTVGNAVRNTPATPPTTQQMANAINEAVTKLRAVPLNMSDAQVRRADKEAAAAEKQAALESEYYSNTRYSRTRKAAEAKGYDAPYRITEYPSGVQQLDYRKVTESGIDQHMRRFNTPAGGDIESTSRQFQTLTSAIGRDIRELTKWSIAIAVIYGPLNALKQLTADMVENETRLANAMIAMVDSGLRVGEVFDIVKESADAMGTGVSDTINSFTLAYRATGSVENSFDRTRIATQLLTDSLILSKLAGMEEASAIDVLAASLRQTNTPLDQGLTLLDKWVKTTQVANVDLETLSTGFAVLGDAAETAGMNIDEINGLLAAIAETGIGTGKEVANAAKAIVAGFYSDKAVTQLNTLGIATEDAEGNLRDFNSIITEVYQQRQLGLISDTAFQTTARDIGGGGNRRQAVVTTLIENYARAQQVAAISANANGEAQAAMGRRLDTVQTASTRLNNAFQSLAQSLGNEGGLLDLFSMTLNVVTGITSAFDGLMSSIGKAGPMLLTVLGGATILRSQGPLAIGSIGKSLDASLLTMFGSSYANTFKGSNQWVGNEQGGGYLGGRTLASLLSGKINRFNLGAGFAIGGILPALQNMNNADEDPLARQKATANIVGSVVGGITSGLLGVSPLIGATIGSSIGESFVNTALGYSGTFGEAFVERVGGTTTTPAPTKLTPEEIASNKLFSSFAGGSIIAKEVFSTTASMANFMLSLSGKESNVTPIELAYNAASTAAKKKYDQAYRLAVASGSITDTQGVIAPSKLDLQQKEQMTLYGTTLTDMRKKREAELLNQLQTGEITPSAYTSKRDSLSTFETRATKFAAVFGDKLIGNVSGINNMRDAYQAFLNLISEGSSEALDAITTFSTEIYQTKNYIEELNKTTLAPGEKVNYMQTGEMLSMVDALKKANDRVTYLESVLPGMIGVGNRSVMASRVNMPSIINQGEAYSRTDFKTILEKTTAEEFSILKQLNPGMGDEEIRAYMESQEKFGVYIEDFGKFVYELVSGVSEGQFNTQAKILAEKGLITTGATVKSRFPSQLDIYSSQFPMLQNVMNQLTNTFTGAGVALTDEDLRVFGKDFIFGTIHGDARLLQIAMEKLIGIEEKQLEGIYNLPDGSFFSVMLTPEWMALMGKNGGGGGLGSTNIGKVTETPVTTTTTEPEVLPDGTIVTPAGSMRPSISPRRPGWDVRNKSEGTKNYPDKPLEAYLQQYGHSTSSNNNPLLSFISSFSSRLIGGINNFLDSGGYKGQTNIPTSRINLNLNNTTTVQLDGRVIATVIKRYLADDLARTTQGYGQTTKSYVQ